ncbi:23S rRNA (uracil(1939)-C(5))-methyltransferase RlmD [Oceanirhabdus sp. W0125-5]|uniref:23S rRNA (uracil(1939)-C(5))-methyltransferase RlmD n=1 Tax=Oceanirhabdus sp. W0125-5 TaxID=2999116 RepID=UPI0022F2B7DD|nr:23S rRNA (uracil(1939)-C(5))-methyltransferase RlmD [Oceanirhabdus sp. W0125-5]WBW95626.1 23S rRNA (uracil(1939)-C(5))-methyltransferase RlmD [Oceanirhabdus sp. W0125-5]
MKNSKRTYKKNFKDNSKFKDKTHKKSVSRKETIEVKCIGMDEEGKGVIIHRNQRVSIPNLLEGETALVELLKKGDNLTGRLIQIKKTSSSRVKAKCPHYGECGGCQLQHMSYKGQSEFKQKFVQELMKPYGKVDPIITMEKPYDYRNKIHSTYAYGKKGEIISGIYEENTHRVIPIQRCIIQDPKADEINNSIRELMKSFKLNPYDEVRRQGFLRHVLIKTGFATKEVMVVLVTGSFVFPSKNNFIKALLKKHPEITTIVVNVNDKKTSMVLGEKEKVLYGKGTISDILCGCTFNISPKSFYQINPIQTHKLYSKAIEMADFKSDEIVLDAYSGIGTIGLILSKNVKSVIGVELNKDAVKDAIKNAKINNIKNARFYEGDAGEFMVKMAHQGEKLDTVMMDPPRSGSDEKFLSSVVKLSPKKVIYISCNPVTQARDLKYLTKHGYRVEGIQPVDMFPHTYHVENIVRLSKQ